MKSSLITTTRRAFLSITTGVAAAAAATTTKKKRKNASAGPQPSLLLIVAPDLGPEMLGLYGGRNAAKTPNIDKLAQLGTRFKYAFSCAAPGAPGLASLLSGATPARLAKQPQAPTLISLLQARAYASEIGDKPFCVVYSHPAGSDLASLDAKVGELWRQLGARADNTLTVFTAAGSKSGAVPLIFVRPGRIPVSEALPDLVSSYDFLPTVADELDLDLPESATTGRCGDNYLPLILGKPMPKKHPWRTMVFGSLANADYVRDRRYHLVLRTDTPAGPHQLFDLNQDPEERVNQYGNRSYVTVRDQLRRQLTDWKKTYA